MKSPPTKRDETETQVISPSKLQFKCSQVKGNTTKDSNTETFICQNNTSNNSAQHSTLEETLMSSLGNSVVHVSDTDLGSATAVHEYESGNEDQTALPKDLNGCSPHVQQRSTTRQTTNICML